MGVLLALHTLATIMLAGLIWFVQLVHYPLFSFVGAGDFVRYEREHTRRVTWIPEQPDSQSSAALQPGGESAVRDWIEASISRGAPLYNAGEPRACAEVYTRTVKSLLCLAPGQLSPQAVERLATAVREAEETEDASERAWILRRAMDFTLRSPAQRTIEPLRAGARRNESYGRTR